MNAGSLFFEEISRTTSSLRPAGMTSASMSVTNPHSYSRLTRASTVFAVVLIVTPRKRRVACYAEKDEPQPQLDFAFGLTNANPAWRPCFT